MKRPEKKEIVSCPDCGCRDENCNDERGSDMCEVKDLFSYNKAIDDYEKFLPSEEEIARILDIYSYISFKEKEKDKRKQIMWRKETRLEISKAIHNRIQGKK